MLHAKAPFKKIIFRLTFSLPALTVILKNTRFMVYIFFNYGTAFVIQIKSYIKETYKLLS